MFSINITPPPTLCQRILHKYLKAHLNIEEILHKIVIYATFYAKLCIKLQTSVFPELRAALKGVKSAQTVLKTALSRCII